MTNADMLASEKFLVSSIIFNIPADVNKKNYICSFSSKHNVVTGSGEELERSEDLISCGLY